MPVIGFNLLRSFTIFFTSFTPYYAHRMPVVCYKPLVCNGCKYNIGNLLFVQGQIQHKERKAGVEIKVDQLVSHRGEKRVQNLVSSLAVRCYRALTQTSAPLTGAEEEFLRSHLPEGLIISMKLTE